MSDRDESIQQKDKEREGGMPDGGGRSLGCCVGVREGVGSDGI